MVALERWFTELGVGWVVHVASSSGELGNTTTSTFDTWSWIRALAEIMETIRLTTSLSPVHGLVGMPSEEPPAETGKQATSNSPDQLKFVQFFHGTMLKMLVFVDVLVREVVVTKGVPVPYMKLSNLLGVHGALSRALSEIWLLFHSPPSTQVEVVERKIASLLSTKEAKAGEAVWSTMEQIRACIIESMDDGGDSSGTPPLQGSSGIHKSTVSVMTYMKFLQKNYLSVAPIVSEAACLGKYVPQIRNIRPLDSMIVEIVSCLEEKLANSSESFLVQALRFLFLLNNSYFIREHLDLPFPSLNNVHLESITHKVKAYMESYIQVSWAPMLSCLLNPAPLCFRRNNYSQLPKFESEFQKICSVQRQWKVPDPKLRKTLRKAITEKVIPEYTECIEDNKVVTTLKLSPRELEEMLQELFEG
jgi:hypothetical protein